MAFLGLFVMLPIFGGFFLFVILVLVTYVMINLILYVFRSFGLLRIAKNEQYKYPYIVWIPVISNYVLARYCMDKKKSIIFLILSIFDLLILIPYLIVSGLNEIFLEIYTVFYFIIEIIVMNKFYQKVYKTPELFTILSIITLGFLNSIFIYTARIKKITKVNLN